MTAYLGKWDERDLGFGMAYCAPQGSTVAIDLRSTGDIERGEGWGVFLSNDNLPREYESLADVKSGRTRQMWQRRLRRRLRGDDWESAVFLHLTREADPRGMDTAKPLLPKRNGNLRFRGKVKRFRFRDSAVAEMLRLDYERIAGRDEEHARRVLDLRCEKYRVGKENPEILLPKKYHQHRPLRHQTVVSDDFDRADEPLEDGNWTLSHTSADFDIVSNQCVHSGPSAGGDRRIARFDTDLSGDDHYSEATIIARTTAVGVAVRNDPASQAYVYGSFSSGSYILKSNGTSHTVLAGPASITESLPDTVRCEADGSDIEGFYNGTSKLTATDSSYSGDLRVGIYGRGCTIDDWEGGDLGPAPGGVSYTQLESMHRGMFRGIRGVFGGTV